MKRLHWKRKILFPKTRQHTLLRGHLQSTRSGSARQRSLSCKTLNALHLALVGTRIGAPLDGDATLLSLLILRTCFVCVLTLPLLVLYDRMDHWDACMHGKGT
jgi:hypothetical protein